MSVEMKLAIVRYMPYWSIPLGLIFAEATHRFYKRGRTGIALGLGIVAATFFLLPALYGR